MGARTRLAAFVALGVVAAACVPPPVTPPPPSGCGSASGFAATGESSGGAGSGSLSVAEAQRDAQAAFASAETRLADGAVPLVVVTEDAEGRPQPVTVAVDSAGEAGGAAGFAAAVVEVVGVDTAQRVSVDTATDPMRGSQWPLDAVDFEGVWPLTTGTGSKVAVVDTGVNASHADLAGAVLSGWEFLNDDPWGSAGSGVDPHGHGTHVAGTVAARTGNGIGTAGAAPGASVLPVRVLDASGSGWDTDIARGIVWAVDHGADVVNLSLGSNYPSSSMTSAVNYAYAAGVVVVAAAGNQGQQGNPPSWPGADTNAIGVAAVDSSLNRASFSTAGSYVDVAAPGVAVLAPYGSGWAYLSGTSMAAPHVSALAALVVAGHPSWTASQVRGAIEGTADDLGSPGSDSSYGRGLIDPVEALGC